MKKSKWLAITGLTVVSTLILAACGSSSASNTYSYVYLSDPDTLDYVNSNRATTSDVITNLVDGLLENDKYGNLVPSIAEDWTVSKDGLTYTYKLRKDAKWYTSDGEEYAEVKAQDFVAGLKHAADENSEALPIVQSSIKGLDAYVKGESKDFSTVGVKAVDDHTVEYTLNQPESYWNSKTTMGILFPINEDFLKSQGKDFGTVKPSSILYNGPYVLKAFTSKSVIEYAKNQNYWDKDNVKVENIKLTYFDGSDQESLIRNFSDGAYSQARLYPTSSNYASVEKQYKDNIIYTPQNSTSFYFAFNLNRKTYNHSSKTSDAQKASTTAAIQNKDFRQAINFAFDRTSFGAQMNGKDGATKLIRSLLVPPSFVQVDGKDFSDVVESQLSSYGDEWNGIKLADAQDSIYNADKAKAEFAKAKETLQAEGVEFPIHIDVPVDQSDKVLVQRTNSFKQSVESALGQENVVIDVQQMSTDDFDNSAYFAETAAQKDYDLNMSGWSADYQDPSTYLNIFNPETGAADNIGIEKGKNADVANKVGLNEYKALLDEADQEKQDTDARYTKYAAAQAWLTDSSIVIPSVSGGGSPVVQKVVPFTKSYSYVGIKGDAYVFKNMELQNDIVTAKDYEAALKKWEKEKEASNKKAQEELEKHIK